MVCSVNVIHAAPQTNDTSSLNEDEMAELTDSISPMINDENNTKTFSNLSNLIDGVDEGSVLELNQSYKFDSSLDNESYINGVVISKDITLIGNNNIFIDGSKIARGLNITSNCTVILKNIIFKNGYASSYGGGAIIVGKYSNLYIDNCTFYGNKVYNANGGAIYGLDCTNIEIHNCEFYNNTGVRVSNLAWKEYKCGMGSVICMRIGSNLKLFDSIVRDNIGSLTTILIITWDDVNINQSTLYIKNCSFVNNTAKSNGVIYLDEFGIAEIIDSVFKDNQVTYYGGTVVFDTSNSAIVKNCTFENNSAINGGAIFISSYNPQYKSHVKIMDSVFSENTAQDYGGAIVSKYCVTQINNVSFIENSASKSGGAIYSNLGSIKIIDSYFTDNSANYGGGLCLKTESNVLMNSLFKTNVAHISGGAVYSNAEKISTSGCIYSGNVAPKAAKIYGAYYAKITKYVAVNGDVKLKIILSSLWNMPLSQKIKIKLSGYSSAWLKTNKYGKLIFTVPKNKKVTKQTLSIKMDEGVCFIKSYLYKSSAKITLSKTVKKNSKLKITLKNQANNQPFKKTKFKIKIYDGKRLKTYNLKTNSKGVIKISMKIFSKSNCKISFYLNNEKNYVYKKLSFKIV